jgi:hypothetical protein
MTDIALPLERREMPNFGVAALIVLAVMSVVFGIRNPEAITAEYQTAAIVLIGP